LEAIGREKVGDAKEWDFAIIKDHKLYKLEARKLGYGSFFMCIIVL